MLILCYNIFRNSHMIHGLSKLFAGEYGINGLLLGGLLVVFGIIIIFATIQLSKKRKKKDQS